MQVMSMISAIAKQEIVKVLKNKKMLSSIFVLPMVVLVAMFAMTSIGEEEEKQALRIHFLNMQVPKQELEAGDMALSVISETAVSYEQFAEENIISENDMAVERTQEGFEIYYDSGNSRAEELLPFVESNILKPCIEGTFLAEQGMEKGNFEVLAEDTSSEMERTNRSASFLIPYMMILILFMNLVSVVGDSIAGEKERGTLTKELLAPIDNSQMILGKLLGTTIVGMFSSAVFFVVLVGGSYLAVKFGGADVLGAGEMAIGPGQIGIMFLGFIFIAMVFVAAIALASSFADTLKEATSMSRVIYYLVIFAALATTFRVGEAPRAVYVIPVYNFSVFMQRLLVGKADLVNGGITVVSLLITFGLLAAAAALNFRRERVIC